MISHVTIAVADFQRALAFYDKVLDAVGMHRCFHDAKTPAARFRGPYTHLPQLMLVEPADGATAHPGNGPMVAFNCDTRQHVDDVHALALTLGATDEGAPGLRTQYHDNFYGGYLRDPEGNKICFVCHDPAWVGSR